MPPSPVVAQDDEHLKLLAIFHYVVAGLTFLGAIVGVIYALMGVFVFQQLPATGATPPPPQELGWIFTAFGTVIAVVCVTLGICQIWAGRCLSKLKSRTFCLVIAAIDCLNFPLGTVLGVFTFIVLLRPTVAARFDPPA